MTEYTLAYYIVMSGPEHLPAFEQHRLDTEQWWWSVPKGAKVGDIAFVYLTAPVARIVGRVTITGEPFHNIGKVFDNPKCDNKFMAPVGNAIYYPEREELTMRGLRRLYSQDWGWVRYPRSMTRIPDDILPPFLELFDEQAYICELCDLQVVEIPRFKKGECPGYLSHQFVLRQGLVKRK